MGGVVKCSGVEAGQTRVSELHPFLHLFPQEASWGVWMIRDLYGSLAPVLHRRMLQIPPLPSCTMNRHHYFFQLYITNTL